MFGRGSIVNASLDDFLSRVDGLDWLTRLSRKRVQIPRAVVDELLHGSDGAAIMGKVNEKDRFTIVENTMPPALISAWDLGAGETQVLSRSLRQTDLRAVLDDWAARQCGLSLGLPVVGTLGIVLAAKRHGLIPLARPSIKRLLAEGLYLTPSLVQDALKTVDE